MVVDLFAVFSLVANAAATTNALALKEDAINKSTTTTLGTSNVLFPTQNAVKTYVDSNITTVNSTVVANATAATNAIAAVQADVNQNEADSDAADVVLQNNITTLQNTVTSNAAANTTALATKEDAANKSTTTTLGTSNVLFPTQNAVKTYVDTNITSVNASNTALQATVAANAAATTTALGLKEDAANKSNAALGTSTTLFPTQNAVKTYVDAQISSATIPDANATTKGKIQLAGDLGGTAAAPTVPGLANKESSANKSTVTTLGNSDELFPTQNAVKTYVDSQVASATIPDANATTKGKIQLAGDLGGTAAAPTVPGLANKENTINVGTTSQYYRGDKTWQTLDKTVVGLVNVDNTTDAAKPISTATQTALNTKEDAANKSTTILLGTSDLLFPTQNAVKTYVDNQIASATIVDADATTKGKLQLAGDLGGTAAAPTVPGLASKAPIASPTFTGTVTAPIYASTPQALTDAATIDWNPTNGLNASVTLGGNRTLSFSSMPAIGSYGTLVVTQDATGGRTITLPSTSNKVLGSTSTTTIALSSAANAKDILNFYYDGTNCYWNIGQGYGTAATTNVGSSVSGVLPVTNGGTGSATLTGYVKGDGTSAMTASSSIPLADVMGAAPIASPTFTGSVTAPIYASTPQALTDAATIDWNPTNGLNASVTLGGNRTLSFTATPAVGSYGTLIVTQDATGGRTINLPSTSNKVLGSTSTTTIALSSAANAKDILNFYYDGTNCYWNIGQGYGSAATVASTNLASGVSGTLPVANGGTGATTLTANNVLLGNGTSALQVVAPGASGNVLTSNGTTWNSTAPAASGVPYTGATQAVDLGAFDLKVNGITVGRGNGNLASNTATGKDALLSNNTIGANNTAMGNQALYSNTFGSQNTAIGSGSLKSNINGIQNTAVGILSLEKNVGVSYNTAVGAEALRNTVDGESNTATGASALKSNISGAYNSAFGRNALVSSRTAYNNAAFGAEALSDNLANGNSAYGAYALQRNTTGYSNTAVGLGAMKFQTTGNDNVAIGVNAGLFASNQTTGSNNTAIGAFAEYGAANLTNATVIGSGATVSASNTIQLGNTAVTNVKTSGTLTAGSVTYPNTHGSTGQVLSTTGSGTLTWVAPAASSLSGTVAVANGGTGATTLTGYLKGNGTSAMTASSTIPVSDVSGAAPLASPALTGTPTAPTATSGTNTTQVATTAFVTSALSSSGLPSQSGNNGKFLTTNGSSASWATGVSGSGTLNYIPRFSSSSALSNSSLSDDGTGLRIGNPNGTGGIYTGLSSYDNTRLMVSGGREYESIRMTFPGDPYNNELSFNWYGTAWRMRTERSSGDITDLSFWRTAGGTTTEAIRIKASGNFGIGVDPSQKLDVAGNVKFSGALMPNNSAGTSGQVLTSAGANAVPTWTTPVSSAASITGTLAVANGGTGTTNGSITGTTALSFAAGGSNQNVSILPSGTGSVGIGTNSPNSSAILDASSTTKGFLPPRMTYAQKIAISSPPQGIMIYCTNCGTNGEPEYFNGVSWVNMSGGPAASVPITLGGTYGGGIVFYIFQSGEPGYVAGETHGLIAATSDTQGYRVFGCRGWPAGTSTALGTGAANTTTLLGCSDTFFAAKLARAVRDGGYTDWYLPSKDELNKLYLNRNSVGNFIDGSYWSSSESSNAAYAWYQIFSDGSQSEDDKNAQKGIRAIRSF